MQRPFDREVPLNTVRVLLVLLIRSEESLRTISGVQGVGTLYVRESEEVNIRPASTSWGVRIANCGVTETPLETVVDTGYREKDGPQCRNLVNTEASANYRLVVSKGP